MFSKCKIDRGRLNCFFMGICFCFIFTGYFTLSNLEKIFLISVKEEVVGYRGDGYTGQACTSFFCALSLWLSPSICNYLGSKKTMFAGALLFIVFTCSFFFTITWVLYVASALLGIGAALLWTGQSAYLVLNSTQQTLESNLGLFFILYQSGSFVGNVFVYFQFVGQIYISAQIRHVLIVFLSVIVALGVFLLLLLPSYEKDISGKDLHALDPEISSQKVMNEIKEAQDAALVQSIESPLETFKKCFVILSTKETLILLVMFCNIGFSYIFTIVYNSCLGFTRKIPNSVELVPIAGLLSGVGGMLGGVAPLVINPDMSLPFSIRPLMLIAFACYIFSYVTAFVSFPNSAIFSYTDDAGIVTPNVYLILFGTFSLHFAETLYNNETAVLLARIFPNDTVSAFAIFLFAKHVFSAITFTGSNFAGLYYQLAALSIIFILGTLSFIYVSKTLHKKRIDTYLGKAQEEMEQGQ